MDADLTDTVSQGMVKRSLGGPSTAYPSVDLFAELLVLSSMCSFDRQRTTSAMSTVVEVTYSQMGKFNPKC